MQINFIGVTKNSKDDPNAIMVLFYRDEKGQKNHFFIPPYNTNIGAITDNLPQMTQIEYWKLPEIL
jgi:hypothetical protein